MIGKALQDLISMRGTNVNELAKSADVSAQTLYSIIKRNNMKIDFDVLMKICKALHVPAEYFYKSSVEQEFPPAACAEDARLQEIISSYHELNENGQASLYQQAKMHVGNPEYRMVPTAHRQGVVVTIAADAGGIMQKTLPITKEQLDVLLSGSDDCDM